MSQPSPFDYVFMTARVLLETRRTPELELYSPCELTRLAAACIASGRLVTPDMLSPQQRANILSGTWNVPTFDDALRPTGGRKIIVPTEARPS